MNRRQALATLTAPLVLPLVPQAAPPLIGYFDLKDIEWDQFGAFNSDGDIIHGIRRSGEMTFSVLYNDDGVDREDSDDTSNVIGAFSL